MQDCLKRIQCRLNEGLHLLSSPEPKAQVSFSDQNFPFSVVGVFKLSNTFHVLYSSPEPLGQFQPNLAQSIIK